MKSNNCAAGRVNSYQNQLKLINLNKESEPMWFFMALASALLSTFRRNSEKILLDKYSHFSVGWTSQLMSLPFLLPVLIFSGNLYNPLTLSAKFWLATIVVCFVFYPLNTFFYLRSIKHGELSKVIPIQSLGPVMALLLAWLFLRQVPSLLSSLGILVTISGVYILNLRGKSLHNPLLPFKEDRASLYMLINIVLVSLVAILDKIGINASSPIYFTFATTLGAAISVYLTARVLGIKEDILKLKNIKEIGLLGFLMAAAYSTYIFAINLGPIAYVSTVKSSNIVFSSALGILRFNEPFTKVKLIAYIVIAAGLSLLALG